MKNIYLIILSLILPSLALAELYVWTDENGKKHYSDQKPVNFSSDSNTIKNSNSFSTPQQPRDNSEINTKLNSIKGKLYAIYNKHLAINPSAKGNVSFSFQITPEGKVVNSSATSKNFNSAFNNQLLSVVNQLSFSTKGVRLTNKQWSVLFTPY